MTSYENARAHYWLLVSDVLATELGDMPDSTSRWAEGEFTPSGSAGLVALEERSSQFLETIATIRPSDESGQPVGVDSAIDAGCGSSAS